MSNQIDTLLAEIAKIPNISQEIADGINATVSTTLPGLVDAQVATATTALQKQIDDILGAVQSIADHLTNGDVPAAQVAASNVIAAATPAIDATASTANTAVSQ